jgi:hypothetical protein
MLKYMTEPLLLKSAAHRIDGYLVIVVYIAPHPDGFTILRTQGQYQVPTNSSERETRSIFRPGDVFIRRGTKSERWGPQDRERLMARRDARLKDEQRAEFARTLADIQQAQQGTQLATVPATALPWNVDAESFDATALELIRHNDVLPLTLFLRRVSADLTRFRESRSSEDLQLLLDRVTQLCAASLITNNDEVFTQGVRALAQSYRSVADLTGYARTELNGSEAAALWWAIIARVEAIGALAIREERWAAVRTLVLQRPSVGDRARYLSWFRHALTHASRDGVLPNEDRGERAGVLIRAALQVADRLEILRLDQPQIGEEGRADSPDGLLDSVCQFDIATAIISAASADPNSTTSQYYPSFAGYYAPRVEPFVRRLLTDPALQRVLLPGADPQTVQEATSDVFQLAHRFGFYGGAWDFDDLQLPDAGTDARAH